MVVGDVSDVRRRIGSISFGSFWYGKNLGFPGFLYKKNTGVGARRSTKMNPGGNITCNGPTYLYNKYKPGGSGVGASSIANRRAKNRMASVCAPSIPAISGEGGSEGGKSCGAFYMYLGQYDRPGN